MLIEADILLYISTSPSLLILTLVMFRHQSQQKLEFGRHLVEPIPPAVRVTAPLVPPPVDPKLQLYMSVEESHIINEEEILLDPASEPGIRYRAEPLYVNSDSAVKVPSPSEVKILFAPSPAITSVPGRDLVSLLSLSLHRPINLYQQLY